MHNLRGICGTYATAALAIGLAVGPLSTARAQSQGDLTEMAAAMKRLEARVTALEDENKQAKRETEAARAEARALRQKLGVASPPSAPPPAVPATASAKAAGTFAMATKAPLAAPGPSWKGFYAGAAFGMGWMRTDEDLTIHDAFTDTLMSPGFTQANTEVTAKSGGLSGRGPGAIANLYLAYNLVATPSVVLGGQVEGSLSNIRTLIGGTVASVENIGQVNTPPDGRTNSDGSTEATTDNFIRAAHVAPDMHSLWIGVGHYFNP